MGSPNLPLRENIIRFLDEAQGSASTQHKLVNGFAALYRKTDDHKKFFEAFFQPFSNILVVYKREPAVERVVAFVVKFAAKVSPTERDKENSDQSSSEDERETSFLSFLIDELLSLHEAKDKAVRFRVCQLVARVLTEANDCHCKLSCDLLDRIQSTMLIRVQDKIPVVRVHAVCALRLFQEPEEYCPITEVLLELMEKDSSPEVRRCVLNNIATSDKSLPAVIQRTRDIKEQIRRDAFLWLANKCEIRHLSIGRRIHLLKVGLLDRSEVVLEACVNGLLRQWSLECNDGDFLSLLARLDVENSADVAEMALVKLFVNIPTEELVSSMRNVMDTSNGTTDPDGSTAEDRDSTLVETEPAGTGPDPEPEPAGAGPDPEPEPGQEQVVKLLSRAYMFSEEVFYWSCLCRYLHKKGGGGEKGRELLDRLLPTLSEFADYVHSYIMEVVLAETEDVEEKARSLFVAQQLCSMLALCDLTDEYGRSRLASLVSNVLTHSDIPVALIPPLLQMQKTIWPQERLRIGKLAEIIAELRQPSLPAPGKDKGRGDKDPSVSNPSLSQSQEDSDLHSPSSSQSDDVGTLLKCLTITCELLKGLRRHKLDNPVLLTLADSLLLPCIQNVDPFVRDMALHCLGLGCLLDLSIARQYMVLFLQVVQVDHEMVQATALKVVFDLLHVYGFETFSNVQHDGAVDKGNNQDGNQDSSQEDSPGDADGEEARRDEEVAEGEGEGQEEEEQGDKDGITQKLLSLMVLFLDGESPLLRGVAGEGICKLLFSGRVLSQKLLAKLLLLWYNPLTQEEADLRSILGLFFPTFASLGRNCRMSLSEIYLPVLQKVLEAPPTSPLASVDTSNISDFILHLSGPLPGSSEESVHDSLAMAVCNECLKDPQSAGCRVFCRTLSLMTLSKSNKRNASDLLVLCGELEEAVEDRTSLRYLRKFRDSLEKICPAAQDPSEQAGENEDDLSAQPSEVGSDLQPTVIDAPDKSSKVASVCNGHQEVGEGQEEEEKESAKEQEILDRVHLKEMSVSVERLSLAAIKQALGPGLNVRDQQQTRNLPRRRRSKPVRVISSDEEDESENENVVPEDMAVQPRRASLHRSAKSSAGSRQYVNSPLREISYQKAEDSDDSMVGEHSPFIKHTRHRCSSRRVQPIQYDDDDDDDVA